MAEPRERLFLRILFLSEDSGAQGMPEGGSQMEGPHCQVKLGLREAQGLAKGQPSTVPK